MRCPLGVLAALPIVCAPASAAQPVHSAAPVAEAERAFAAEVGRSGFKRGFLTFAAPDAIMFQPCAVEAHAALAKAPDKDPPGPPLNWWPLWAGISASGDLGFTTGGANIPVRYFTVWQKQPDGSWKWIYDGGPPLKEKIAQGPETPVTYLKPATAAAGSADKALAEIAPIEAEIASRAATNAKEALLHYLAEDGLAAGTPDASEMGRSGQLADLERRPLRASMKAEGGVASKAGDLAFTYGEVRWAAEGKPRWGHYARMWQKRKEGWRLVSDMVVPAPGAPPTA